MKAFHNNHKIKENVLAQLQVHHDADEIIKGRYWENGKGCAVGCTIHSGEHKEYERRFGIPESLARLEDFLFEKMPDKDAKTWPIRFIEAVPVGVDLRRVEYHFKYWLLTDESINHGINHPLVKDAVADVAAIVKRQAGGEEPSPEEISAAKIVAESAARWAACGTATSVARSDEWIGADSAESAESAALCAESAARSPALCAESAARSAARSAATTVGWSAVTKRMSEKLVELLKEAK